MYDIENSETLQVLKIISKPKLQPKQKCGDILISGLKQ